MEKQVFISVDGGGTKTEALMADTNGNVLAVRQGAGSNPYTVGKDKAAQVVNALIGRILLDHPAKNISAAWLYIPGFFQCLPLPFPFDTVCLGDEYSSYFGALAQPGGIVVLAGTGSFAVSIDKGGKITSVGGWGPMLGDEGSGYDIGRRAVRHAFAVYDADKPPTPVSKAVLAHYQTNTVHKLRRAVYQRGWDPKHMAGLCKPVGTLATEGDMAALDIIRQAALSLAGLAIGLQKRLRLGAASVSLTGGLTGLGESLLEPFKQRLARDGLMYHRAKYPPAVGGVLYTCMSITRQAATEQTADSYYKTYLKARRVSDNADGCLF